MQLVVIAGGKGTRLQERLGDRPKPMVEVDGKPLIEHQVLLARKHGIGDILILTGYGAEYIERYFGDGSAWGVRIDYQRELEPLGTAGALLDARHKLEDTFVVMYGDTMVNVDLQKLIASHSAGASATLLVHPNDHPQDSDLVEMNERNEIVAFHPYPHAADANLQNLVNAALYVFSKQATELARSPADIAKQLFPALLANGKTLCGYRSREYIKDAGTPERLDRVRSDYQSGRVTAASFDAAIPAVFLDRDGTLNRDHGWLNLPEKLELLPGAAEAVHAINRSGRLAVLITNQPVVARGECSEAGLRQIHNRLEWLLGKSHAYLDAIYYCPHHPDSGYPGERVDLKIACACRKPATGLLELASRDLNIDVSRSWMIGDSTTDIQAAKSFGIPSVLVSGAVTIRDAVDQILSA